MNPLRQSSRRLVAATGRNFYQENRENIGLTNVTVGRYGNNVNSRRQQLQSRAQHHHHHQQRPFSQQQQQLQKQQNPQPINVSSVKLKPTKKKKDANDGGGGMHFVKAGLPMLLFCGLGVWVVSSGIEGKNRERDAFQGRISKSERQAMMDKEHDDMMEKLKEYTSQEFDNTRRIERPEEVLERRRKERQARNAWYKRWWNSVVSPGGSDK